jgi:hypothetical protein
LKLLCRLYLDGACSRAVAAGIAANEETALVRLNGVNLCEHLDVLGLSDEFVGIGNYSILEHIRERHIAGRVKSARGGAAAI